MATKLDTSEVYEEKNDMLQKIKKIADEYEEGSFVNLDIPYLEDIEVAQIIAQIRASYLMFNNPCFTQLNPLIARELVKSQSKNLLINSLTEISEELAVELIKFSGEELSLGDFWQNDDYFPLKSMNVDTAKVLAGFRGSRLNILLKQISGKKGVAIAKALAGFKGHKLGIITSFLDKKSASELATFGGTTLAIDGMTTLKGEIVEELVKFRGSCLDLKHLNINNLEPSGIKALAKFNGKIECDDDDLLDAITETKKNLEIKKNRSINISHEAAEQIKQWLPVFQKHPNIKEVVIKESRAMYKYLNQNGIKYPKLFHNLNANFNIQPLVANVLSFFESIPNGLGLQAYEEVFNNACSQQFQNSPEFIEIYKDEVIQALADHLIKVIGNSQNHFQKKASNSIEKKITFLQEQLNNPALKTKVQKRYRRNLEQLLCKDTQKETSEIEEQIKKAQSLLGQFKNLYYIRPNQSSFKLASRKTEELSLGDECSDCTSSSIGGTNFWTVPTWLTDPWFNFLLQYDEKGNLAHKFGLVWEITSRNKIILTIDSIELGNSQKPQAGMYQEPTDTEKEEQLKKEALEFIQNWASAMGLNKDNIYASIYSNTTELNKYQKVSLTISKLGALETVEKILKKYNPDYDSKPKIYLQSYKSDYDDIWNENSLNIESGTKVFRQVEIVINDYLNSNLAGTADYIKVEEILKLAQKNPEEAARQMRIFFVMEAKKDTKNALSVDNERIDAFLNSRGHSLEAYFKSMLGYVCLAKHQFVEANLYHISPKSSSQED